MRLRTFNAASIPEAMRHVRAELGPDAVILATEQIGKSVKVTAALDRAALLEPDGRVDPQADPIQAIAKALDFHRLPSPLADRLIDVAGSFLLDNPRQALGAALRARFSYAPIIEQRPERPVLLVGLPGAGKTATLAKLAARAKVKNIPVVAITCDLVKAGAVEQLAIYTKALNMPAFRAKDAPTLKRAVAQVTAKAAGKDAAKDGVKGGGAPLVLIDTVGSNPFLSQDLGKLKELAESARAEIVLVLAAGGDVAESAELGALYGEIGATRLIATRADAARRYGGIFAAADAGKLALAEFGVSPEIARGLAFLGADALARLMMPEPDSGKAEAKPVKKTAIGRSA